MADFAGGFASKEEKADPIHDSYAAILNSSLRNKPNDANLRTVMQSIKIPQNVPNLTVPATNPDITKAMGNGGKQIDLQLFRTNALIAKAIVPLASFVADVGQKKDKPAAEYLEGVNSSVRMLAVHSVQFCESIQEGCGTFVCQGTRPWYAVQMGLTCWRRRTLPL